MLFRSLQADPTSDEHRRVVGEVLAVLRTAVREHNEKEETTLFPLLGEDAPTAVFEEEHRTLWALERELAVLLTERGSAARVAAVALEIVNLLRGHIGRENAVLFPMARAVLGPAGLELLCRRLG